mmetsp:Transcript_20807/g.39090  ORF Transcript_20807/g.39090 Transcript_20807/m.39090 type:complete len:204 (+) Transcript_20807:212-823(+)
MSPLHHRRSHFSKFLLLFFRSLSVHQRGLFSHTLCQLHTFQIHRILHQEVQQRIEISGSLIYELLSELLFLLHGRVEDEGRIAGDLLLAFIFCGIHLCNDNTLLGISKLFNLLRQLRPNWCKLFAVAAPWRIEFDKDILLGVHDNFLKGVTCQHGHAFFNCLRWETCTFVMRLGFLGQNVCKELLQSLLAEVLQHVLLLLVQH